jgi:hypothetical protein
MRIVFPGKRFSRLASGKIENISDNYCQKDKIRHALDKFCLSYLEKSQMGSGLQIQDLSKTYRAIILNLET